MAIAYSSLAAGTSATDTDSYSTASISPTASRLIVACFYSVRNGAEPATPTVSGNGLTWLAVDSFLYSSIPGDRYDKVFIFAASTGDSPSSGAVTFAQTGITHRGAGWSVFELNGTDVANGVTQCFVQVVKTVKDAGGFGTGSITLSAAGAADNRPFLFVCHNANEATTFRVNWTEIGDTNVLVDATWGLGLETQWRSDTFETTASATWSSNARYGAMAFEVKEDTGVVGGGGLLDPFGMSGFFGA